ncbi:MAG: hypothetical protein AB8B65_18070 [Kordia sp.]|uniref:hypothetical protein n=1 Tax=Kordia sp. TaxID=1965332 RepID=UPI0038587645
MKKQRIKNLNLNRKTISKLEKSNQIQGGAQYSTDCWTDIFTSVFISCPEPLREPDSFFPNCSRFGDCPMI